MKIAIIGAGNMGGSIARGLAKGSLIDDSDIIVSNPSTGKLEKLKKEFPGISITNSRYCHPCCQTVVYGTGDARIETEKQTDTHLRSCRHQF